MTNKRPTDYNALAARWQREAEDWSDPDEATSTALVHQPATFVPPAPARQPVVVHTPEWLASQLPAPAEAAWAPIATQMEHSDPITRAKATGLRMLAWGLVWLGAGLVAFVLLAIIGAKLPYAAAAGALLWVTATAVTSYRVARLDHEVSAGGVERHRIDKGYDLAREQMRHEASLKRMALDAWLASLERHDRAQLEDKRR